MKTTERHELKNENYQITAAMNALTALRVSLHPIKIEPSFLDSLTDLDFFLRGRNKELLDEIELRKSVVEPHHRDYVRRTLTQIPAEIANLEREIKQGHGAILAKREQVMEAGVSNAEALRLFPDFNEDDLRGKIAALARESRQWDKFLKMGLPELLPVSATA